MKGLVMGWGAPEWARLATEAVEAPGLVAQAKGVVGLAAEVWVETGAAVGWAAVRVRPGVSDCGNSRPVG